MYTDCKTQPLTGILHQKGESFPLCFSSLYFKAVLLSPIFCLCFWVLHRQSPILLAVNLPPAPVQCDGPDSALPFNETTNSGSWWSAPRAVCKPWHASSSSPSPSPSSPQGWPAPTPSAGHPGSQLLLAHGGTVHGRKQCGGREHQRMTGGHQQCSGCPMEPHGAPRYSSQQVASAGNPRNTAFTRGWHHCILPLTVLCSPLIPH